MSVLAELKRRNVFRVGALYLVSGWLILQVADVLAGLLSLPEWSLRFVGFILLLGFPVALVFSWAYELTPEGLKREADVNRGQSIVAETGRRLDYLTIGLVLAAATFLIVDRMLSTPPPPASSAPMGESAAPVGSGPSSAPAPGERDEARRLIAVLPFVNLSTEPDNVFFADGVTEEILNRLAQVPGLNLVARSSSFAFKNEQGDVREIGRNLGADHILEGSVRQQADRVRIAARLIKTSDGTQLWADTFDHQLDDVFAIQDQIAESVAHALDIILDDHSRTAMRNVGIRDVDAFTAFQRGWKLSNDAHNADIVTPATIYPAFVEFNKAIEHAPDFSAAHLAKSDYYAHVMLSEGTEEPARIDALRDMRESLDLAHELARDPTRKAWIAVERALFSDDWTNLPVLAEEALGSPGCVNANWLKLLQPFGLDASIRGYLARRIHCDPGFVFSYAYLAELAVLEDEFASAEEFIRRGEAIGGSAIWLRDARRLLHMRRGHWDAVLGEFAGEASSWRGLMATVSALVATGRMEQARQLVENREVSDPPPLHARIITHAIVGNRDVANRVAAQLDQRAGGILELIRATNLCRCGAPFDLSATPNFAARISEAGFPWPPETVIRFSTKGE